MLVVTVVNTTHKRCKNGTAALADKDGLSDYAVVARINKRIFWSGAVKKHRRDFGAAVLLRLIADKMESTPTDQVQPLTHML